MTHAINPGPYTQSFFTFSIFRVLTCHQKATRKVAVTDALPLEAVRRARRSRP